MRAVDAAGNSVPTRAIATATTPAAPDTTPPTAPTGLAATAVSASRINLDWTAATDNVAVTGYRVERCQGAGCTNFAQVGTPDRHHLQRHGPAGEHQLPLPRARGRRRRQPRRLLGHRDRVDTAAPDTTPPTAPTGLTATAVGPDADQPRAGRPSTDNVGVTGYRVERCQGAGCTNFAQIATPTATSYSDTGLAPSTTYRYRVRAVDAAGNLSAYSDIATATTPAVPDTTPPTDPDAADGDRRRCEPGRI